MSEFGSARKRRLDTSGYSLASPASSMKSFRSAADLDELRLVNEQLQDELRSAQDEMDRVKEKHGRQIVFLEEENDKLKKVATEAKEKYFDEKKKWQAKYREAVKSANNLSVSFSASSPASTTKKPADIALDGTSVGPDWTARLESLERDVNDRANEARKLAVENAELKRIVLDMENTHASSSTGAGGAQEGQSSSSSADYRAEARELRKRCGDLEISVRRKTRELERLEGKIQNQSVLEEELGSANSKLKTMTSAVESARLIEAQHQSLLEERKTWSALLKDTLGRGKAGGGDMKKGKGLSGEGDDFETLLMEHTNTSGDVSPMALIGALSTTQQQVALLLKEKGDIESNAEELKRRLATAESAAQKTENTVRAASQERSQMAKTLHAAQQQVGLYSSEVKSLRSLLQSFDGEFTMGKRPKEEDYLEAKNTTIAQLREDLDRVRAEASALLLESEAARCKGGGKEEVEGGKEGEGEKDDGGGAGAVAKDLRAQVAALKEHLRQAQAASGLDYVPGKTRVLHFKHNPMYQAAKARGEAALAAYELRQTQSTLPLEALQTASAEIRKLKQEQQQQQQAGDRASASPSAGGTTNTATTSAPAATPAVSSTIDTSKLNLRLKEMFKERITTFRESVYLLTGWKIDMIFHEGGGKDGGGASSSSSASSSRPQLRLRNMYAEQSEDSLVFQWTDQNKLNLIETPYAARMDTKLLQTLQTLNSVPIFLGAVTSDLFDMQTVM
jgi:DNA repair exonuclease SbcCD ATPase subunit